MKESKLISKIYHLRIRSALLCIILVIALAKPNPYSIGAGILITIVGLLIRAWACVHIRKEKRLAVSGQYRYTRNPLYLGNLIIGIAISAGANSWWVTAVFSAYFLTFYTVAVLVEKDKMERLFPKEYGDYKKNVPLFFPRLRPYRGSSPIRSDPHLYKENRERRALIGSAVFWIILALKMVLL